MSGNGRRHPCSKVPFRGPRTEVGCSLRNPTAVTSRTDRPLDSTGTRTPVPVPTELRKQGEIRGDQGVSSGPSSTISPTVPKVPMVPVPVVRDSSRTRVDRRGLRDVDVRPTARVCCPRGATRDRYHTGSRRGSRSPPSAPLDTPARGPVECSPRGVPEGRGGGPR